MTTETVEQAVDINNLSSKAKIFGSVYSLFDNSLDSRTNAVDLDELPTTYIGGGILRMGVKK